MTVGRIPRWEPGGKRFRTRSGMRLPISERWLLKESVARTADSDDRAAYLIMVPTLFKSTSM